MLKILLLFVASFFADDAKSQVMQWVNIAIPGYTEMRGLVNPSQKAAFVTGNRSWRIVTDTVRIDSLGKNKYLRTGDTFLSIDDSGYVWPTPEDSMSIPINAVTGLSTALSDRPTLSTANSLYKPIGYVPAWTDITGKPTFANMAFTGSYNDLSGLPDLSVYYLNSNPSGYISSSAVAAAYQPIGTYATASNTMTFTNKTWNGVAITDSYISSASTWNAKQNAIITGTTAQYFRGDLSLATFPTNLSSFTNGPGYLIGSDTTSLSTRINAKYNQPNGTTSQYIRGDGSISTFPTIPNDYTNTVNTVADSAVFWLTSDKTSGGTAIYTNVLWVGPFINDITVNPAFAWTISDDKKKLVVRSRVATNTFISLLGINLLGGTIPVTTGVTISVLVKGN